MMYRARLKFESTSVLPKIATARCLRCLNICSNAWRDPINPFDSYNPTIRRQARLILAEHQFCSSQQVQQLTITWSHTYDGKDCCQPCCISHTSSPTYHLLGLVIDQLSDFAYIQSRHNSLNRVSRSPDGRYQPCIGPRQRRLCHCQCVAAQE